MENILKSSFFLLSLFILLGQEASGGGDSVSEDSNPSQCIDECTERDESIADLKKKLDELWKSIEADLKNLLTPEDWNNLNNPGELKGEYDFGSPEWQKLLKKLSYYIKLDQDLQGLANDNEKKNEKCEKCPKVEITEETIIEYDKDGNPIKITIRKKTVEGG
ncbi:CLUMA_CG011092, isoform A [Clunio marinus]|uniref:CLUMA_CG011092, isoform A n=1 Tax=Clunio marinus TaxID=568069 RepID=A0A1J1IBV3_9DIPT|nr:CLUMA_CG011092, isoform A [Clunio marinus]